MDEVLLLVDDLVVVVDHGGKFLDLSGLGFQGQTYLLPEIKRCDVDLFFHEGEHPVFHVGREIRVADWEDLGSREWLISLCALEL